MSPKITRTSYPGPSWPSSVPFGPPMSPQGTSRAPFRPLQGSILVHFGPSRAPFWTILVPLGCIFTKKCSRTPHLGPNTTHHTPNTTPHHKLQTKNTKTKPQTTHPTPHTTSNHLTSWAGGIPEGITIYIYIYM